MQLRRLRLRNIRSYEEAELELGPGTTLVAGDVGAGKTSLLYAIEMALFGFAEVDPTHLIRHGAVHAEVSVGLEHDAHVYEVSRLFRRVTRRGRETFEVERMTFSKDGAKTVYSTTEMRQQVIDLFGFPDNPNPRTPSDLWRWAVYVPQERMREVLAQRPEERLETVRKALGVERYRYAAENALEVASELRQTARARREEAERLAHHESELGSVTRELDGLEAVLLALVPQLAAGRSRLDSVATARAEADATRQATLGDRRELEGLERESERDSAELEARIARLGEISPQLAQSVPTTEEIGALTRRWEALEVERSELDAARTQLGAEREALESRVRMRTEARAEHGAAERRCEEYAQALQRSNAEVESARAAVDVARREGPTKEPPAPTPRSLPEIEESLRTAQEKERGAEAEVVQARTESEEWAKLLTAGVCPRCRQRVRPEDFEPHRAESTERLLARTTYRDEAHAEVTALDEERRSRERYERVRDRWLDAERSRGVALEALRSGEARRAAVLGSCETARELEHQTRARAEALDEVVAQEADWKRRSGELTARHERLAEDLRSARERRDGALRARELQRSLVEESERLRAEVEARDVRRAERGVAIERLRRACEVLPELERAAVAALEAESTARQEVVRLRLEEVRRQGDAQALRIRRALAEEGVAERVVLVGEAKVLDAKAEWLARPFREALLTMEGRILASAQASFQRDFARFFRTLLDDPRIEARIGESFTPSVLLGGEWTPPDALSGGERTCLALAFRLALGRVVRTMGDLHLDTLILDEPTDGFSPEQIVRMGELLETLPLPQVILVSHEAELEAVADRVIEARKTEGISQLDSSPPTPGPSGSAKAPEIEGPPPRRRPPRPRPAKLPVR